MKRKDNIINEANQIVTEHLIKRFLEEADYYLALSDGNQHLVINDTKLVCILDTTNDDSVEGLIEKFCSLFTDKDEILVDVYCLDGDEVEFPVLRLTLQSGDKFYLHDFSKNYFIV